MTKKKYAQIGTGSRGEMKPDSKFFIASVTKLYVTAVVVSLIEEGRLNLNDKIAKHLPSCYAENIHVLKGTDHSNDITVMHLISNTSGLPDYFTHKEQGKPTASDHLSNGNDEAWDIDKTISEIKKMTPKFAPGQKGKVSYSDTNYQLLGKIIEAITTLFNFTPELIERYRCEVVKFMNCDHAKEYINSACDLAIERKWEKTF